MSLFRLDVDAHHLRQEITARAPELEPCFARTPGLRLMRPSDPVEVFFSFLCTACNHLTRIAGMVERLAAYGDSGGFPSAERVAEIPEGELRAQGFGYRAATIPEAARELVQRGGREYLAGLAARGYETAHRELRSIRSIGPKLADCICLYGLDCGEAVPIDTHLWQAACETFFPHLAGKPLTESRYRHVGDFFRDRFGRLAGWAHLVLYFDHMATGRGPSAAGSVRLK